MCIVTEKSSEETASFECAQSGCAECTHKLMKQHNYLVYLVVRSQYPGGVEYADLSQEGRIGLWKAILHYRPEVGSKFWGYASVAIRRHVWRAVKREGKKPGWEEEKRRGDSLAKVIERWQEEQVGEALREELACLPERMQQVIEQAYGLNGQAPMKLAEIGRQMGLTGERIRQIRNEALVVLRLPALSMRLRGLCEEDSCQAYREARRTNDAWLRQRRGRR